MSKKVVSRTRLAKITGSEAILSLPSFEKFLHSDRRGVVITNGSVWAELPLPPS